MLKTIEKNNISGFEKGPIRRSLFSNGATYLFHKASGFSGAKVNLYFLSGSVFEKESEYGLSHMIEHMIFKEFGTELTKRLELHGAEINAYTYKEYVCFEMSCLGRDLDSFLKDFYDLFFSLNFTETELEKEKKVIVQELKEDLDDHEVSGYEILFEKNFDEKLGHPIGGSITNVKKFTSKMIKDYYRKYYTPERILVTIAAEKEKPSYEKTLTQAMERHFKFKNKKPFRLKSQDKIGKLNHFNSTREKKMESSILFLSFSGATLNSRLYYDFAVLDEILFEGLSSTLFKKLREERPLVYGLGSSLNSFKSNANYVMQFNCQKKDIGEVYKTVLSSLDEILEQGFCEESIELIKKRIINNSLLAFDSIEQRADFISDNEIYELDELSLESIEARVAKVDLKSIQKLIKKLKTTGHSKLALVSKK